MSRGGPGSAPPRYPYVHVDVEDAQRAEVVAADLWELGALGVEERDDSTLSRGAQGAVTLVASFTDDAAARRAVEQLRATAPDCGAHVEQVLGNVPEKDRCQCKPAPKPSAGLGSWFSSFGKR